jgi:hypothetical protein
MSTGSRNKLGEGFLADLYADRREGGIAAIARARVERPDVYLRAVASILPSSWKSRMGLSMGSPTNCSRLSLLPLEMRSAFLKRARQSARKGRHFSDVR